MALTLLLTTASVFAAVQSWTCPYCKQTWYNGFSDPKYVQAFEEFKQRHTAACPQRQTGGGSAPGGSIAPSGPSPADLEAQRRNEAERQRLIAEQQKKAREDAQRKQAEFERAKAEALRSMKGITENELGLKGLGGSGNLGLKGLEGTAVGALELKGVGDSTVKTLFEKGDQNSAPVDTRVKGPSRLDIPGGTAGAPPLGLKGLPTQPASSPKGQPRPAAKPARVTQLSDADLAAEIARARRAMGKMNAGFQADVKDLQAWTRESQEAQLGAIRESLDLLTYALKADFAAGAYDALPEGSEATRVQLAAASASLDLARSGVNYTGSAHQRQDRLEAAQALLQSGYDYLAEADLGGRFSKYGSSATAFASFALSYNYEATRWSISNRQIHLIIDNLGSRGTKGKLKAQQALGQYYKSLVDEQKRRKLAAQ